MVAELDARDVPGAQADCCLIRETDSSVRRLWHYPADWNRLDDAKLSALFDQPFRWRESSTAERDDSCDDAPHAAGRDAPDGASGTR